MPEQIYIGNFAKGLKLDRLPFNIDNDAFPTMYNFYSWRGRAKRKRGTLFLGRLQRQVVTVPSPTVPWQFGPGTLTAGDGNLITGFGLQSSGSIVPGTVILVSGANTYTEPSTPNGTLIGTPGGSGTINYATGAINLVGAGATFIGFFSYYPDLPVLGLEDFASSASSSLYPLLLAFDQTYAYQINDLGNPVFFYSVSFYKGTNNPVTWSGGDYQQFWSTNYSGAFWATNNKPGFHFLLGGSVAAAPSTTILFAFTSSGLPFPSLIVGDKLWFNEWGGTSTVNGQTGTVTTIVNPALGQYIITFATAQVADGNGISQMLTNSIPNQDGIRWYDGDPTSGTGYPTGTGLGWVNFSPPLTALTVSIDDTPAAKYYLVGALAILPFKDRLLFFSPYIQTSTGAPILLEDTVLWSWNGTPYYNAVVPINQTFNIIAYYVDQTGAGGYLPAGIPQPIITVSNNEDALLIGFGGDGRKTRFVYTGNDLQPFLFFNINSELPSSSTFSAVALDRGVIDIGQYGIAMTDQQSCQRIDLDIPDSVFQINASDNGVERVNAVRDFFREWIYFCYPVEDSLWKFPTQTFLFNYRDNTWGILYENFTAHGTYRANSGYTWQTLPYSSWTTWNEPWNSGAGSSKFPSIVAGNPQGYVLIKGQGTGEAPSGDIAAVTNVGGNIQITSVNHCVSAANPNTGTGDYLYFQNALGTPTLNTQIAQVIATPSANTFVIDVPFPITATITNVTQATQAVVTANNNYLVGQTVTISGVLGMTQLNGNTYTVVAVTSTTFTLNVDSTGFTAYISGGTATPTPYVGLGIFTRLSQPLIQTKQFPVYWNQGRQVRLCVQKYLMDFTRNSQVTVNIYLSQDPSDAWNNPALNVPPNSLVYSQIMFTCPESTNIGLTPANTNLQMPTAEVQKQIWHRFNTSLIGDSVQIGITLSDAQMRNLTYATDEITLHGMHLVVDKGPHLA